MSGGSFRPRRPREVLPPERTRLGHFRSRSGAFVASRLLHPRGHAFVALACLLVLFAKARPLRAEEPPVTVSSSVDSHPRRMSDAAELERVVELYLSGQYDSCLEEFGRLLDVSRGTAFTDPQILERGRLYAASCAVLSGRLEAARGALKAALDANPLMSTPDSLTFPPPLVGLFLEVREEVQQLILAREREQIEKLRAQADAARAEEQARAHRERELVALAEEELVRVRSSRLIASVPFGVGQFQNGNSTLGTVLLVAEGALLATAVTSSAVLLQFYSDEFRESRTENQPISNTLTESDAQSFRTTQMTAAVSTVGFGVLALLGVLEAHLAFEEERVVERRRRPLPSPLSPSTRPAGAEVSRPGGIAGPGPLSALPAGLTPVVTGGADGFFVGATLRF